MRRRASLRTITVVVALFSGALFVQPASADGVSDQQQQVKDDLAKISSLEQKASQLNEQYLGYVSQITDLDAQITTGQQQIVLHQAELSTLQTQLGNLAVEQFMGGSSSGITTLLGGTDAVTDSLQRDQLRGVGVNAGSATTDGYEQLLHQLDGEQKALQSKQDKATKLAQQAKDASAATAQAGLDYQAELAKDQAKLGDLLVAEQQRQAAAAEAARAADVAAIAAREAAATSAARQAAAKSATPAVVAPVVVAPAVVTPAVQPATGGTDTPTISPATPTTTKPPNNPTPTPTTAPAPADGGGSGTSDTTPAADSGSSSVDTPSTDPAPPPASSLGQVAADAARSQLGVPYRYATSSPGVNFDCSGLTSYAWRMAGVSIPHQSGQQYGSTAHVAISDIQPGDLLYYYSPISHVAIYIGGGQVIQAPAPGKFVEIAPINWKSIVGASRPG